MRNVILFVALYAFVVIISTCAVCINESHLSYWLKTKPGTWYIFAQCFSRQHGARKVSLRYENKYLSALLFEVVKCSLNLDCRFHASVFQMKTPITEGNYDSNKSVL